MEQEANDDLLSAFESRMRECPGWKVFLAFRRIKGSHYAFRRNYRELKSALDVYHQPGITIGKLYVDGDLSIERYMREINRLALNYLASAEALLDHTASEIIELYKQHPFRDEYFRETKGNSSANFRCFMRGLRHYAAHCNLPLAFAEFTVQVDRTLLGRIMLRIPKLREHSKYWKGKGKRYMASMPDQLDVAGLFADHKASVIKLFDWLADRQNEIHRDELDELAKLRRQLHEATE